MWFGSCDPKVGYYSDKAREATSFGGFLTNLSRNRFRHMVTFPQE